MIRQTYYQKIKHVYQIISSADINKHEYDYVKWSGFPILKAFKRAFK